MLSSFNIWHIHIINIFIVRRDSIVIFAITHDSCLFCFFSNEYLYLGFYLKADCYASECLTYFTLRFVTSLVYLNDWHNNFLQSGTTMYFNIGFSASFKSVVISNTPKVIILNGKIQFILEI